MNIQSLEKEFEGTEDVKGFKFQQIEETEEGFIYEVIGETESHYEVFKIKLAKKCIDFENRIYSETEFKVRYPKTNDFGKTAWCTKSFNKAVEILDGLKKNE